jgi:Ser/Thr protein kinase RdoA (MazF antagonist)
MAYLSPRDHPVWKQQLLDGQVDLATAAAVGRVLATLHLASSRDATVERSFDTGANFHALRLDPYLLATARVHPALAPALEALVERTAGTRLALVHGDVSPKNILVGPNGPVFLDAECAWYGDPAFDVAFCLNHLLLKCLVRPDERQSLRRSFEAFVDAYFAQAGFEPRIALESRAASLLPGLLLARVDGKSPVEYLRAERDRELVRRAAAPMVLRPPAVLAEVLGRWHGALAASN